MIRHGCYMVLALVGVLFLTAGCSEFTDSASTSDALLYTPVNGDTVRVSATSGFADRGAPRLVWGTTLPLDSKPHRMELQISTSPTFDAMGTTFLSQRYGNTQQTYSVRVPQPREFTGTDAPVRLYWRVRVAGTGEGPWTPPGAFVVLTDQ